MPLGIPVKNGSATGTTRGPAVTLTTTSAIAAGSLIIVSFSGANVGDTSNLASVTDTAGNTYTSAAFTCDPGQNTLTAVWYCANCLALASGSTITATLNVQTLASGNSWEIFVHSVTGAATASVVDGTQVKNSQTGATWNTGTGLTTTNANDLLWCAAGVNQGEPAAQTNAASTPNTGWTIETALRAGPGTGGGNGLDVGYQVVSTTGTYIGAGTAQNGNNGTSAVLVAFKATSGGGGSSVQGAVSLSASLALAPSAAMSYVGVAPLSASLSLSPAAVLALTGASPLAGSLLFSPAGVMLLAGSAVLAGELDLLASAGGGVVVGSAALSGNLTLTPQGVLALEGAAALSAALTLFATQPPLAGQGIVVRLIFRDGTQVLLFRDGSHRLYVADGKSYPPQEMFPHPG